MSSDIILYIRKITKIYFIIAYTIQWTVLQIFEQKVLSSQIFFDNQLVNSRLVIIPTYNEIENIEKIIHKVLSLEPHFDILVIDDNSPDGTATAVKNLQEEHRGKIHMLEDLE